MAWFICPMKIRSGEPGEIPERYCAMNDFTPQIVADGGDWSESEVLGGWALVKVRASAATLAAIGGTTGFFEFPNILARLDSPMTALTNPQRSAITARVLAMGYTQAELDAVMGSSLAQWRTRLWRALLAFIASRRLKPRWDSVQQQIVLDGAFQACRPVDDVEQAVAD